MYVCIRNHVKEKRQQQRAIKKNRSDCEFLANI